MSDIDQLEQKCYDLDAKIKRVEEERDAVINENEELQDQVATLRRRKQDSSQERRAEQPMMEEIQRLNDETLRLDAALIHMRENFALLSEKLKELNGVKDTVKSVREESNLIKEDFVNLKNQLSIAAKIELQTNEKMYEHRIRHLENMLEEMRHREESFLHIAEETNILKDQVDSLRELSLANLSHENALQNGNYQNGGGGALTLDKELTIPRQVSVEESPGPSLNSPEQDYSENSILENFRSSEELVVEHVDHLRKSIQSYSNKLQTRPLTVTTAASATVLPTTAASFIQTSSTSPSFKVTGHVTLKSAIKSEKLSLEVISSPTSPNSTSTVARYLEDALDDTETKQKRRKSSKDKMNLKKMSRLSQSDDSMVFKQKPNCCTNTLFSMWFSCFS